MFYGIASQEGDGRAMERRAEPQPSGLGILPTAAAGLHTNVHTYIHTLEIRISLHRFIAYAER